MAYLKWRTRPHIAKVCRQYSKQTCHQVKNLVSKRIWPWVSLEPRILNFKFVQVFLLYLAYHAKIFKFYMKTVKHFLRYLLIPNYKVLGLLVQILGWYCQVSKCIYLMYMSLSPSLIIYGFQIPNSKPNSPESCKCVQSMFLQQVSLFFNQNVKFFYILQIRHSWTICSQFRLRTIGQPNC